jgi:hypothetical protein
MKTIDEIRRDNIAILVEEHGGVKSLAVKLEKSEAQVSQWLNGSKDSKTGKQRGMNSDTSRSIEGKAGKERGWMDHDHSDTGLEQFKHLPTEVRAWLMRQGNQTDEQETKDNGTQ